MDDCVFCSISRGKIPVKRIYENDNFFSIPDAKPKVKGHSLVIPKKHFKTLLDIPDTLTQELLDCIKKTALKILKENKADGFNVVSNNFASAGQIVNHAHFHILPRKQGDGFRISV